MLETVRIHRYDAGTKSAFGLKRKKEVIQTLNLVLVKAKEIFPAFSLMTLKFALPNNNCWAVQL